MRVLRRYPPAGRLLLLAVLLFPAASGRSLGQESPWWAGLYAESCGFSERTGLPAAEYLAFGAFIEPLSLPLLNPSLYCGLLLPVAPFRDGGTRYQIAGELTLFDLEVRALERCFYTSLCWSPALGTELLVEPDFHDFSFTLLLAPLRVRAADALISVGSVQLFMEPGFRLRGWGFALFKTAVFLL